jgi:hypothetical protein
MNGFKWLDPTGATEYNGVRTVYPLPGPNEKWGPIFKHPESVDPDGKDCGPGGWHIMKRLRNVYGPRNGWPWFARSVGEVLGESDEKFRTTAIQLRRITPKAFYRMIRLGFCSGANLSEANLRYADLRGANLRNADFRNANLRYAYLRGANLSGANLRNAYLRNADLRNADLRNADLGYANLSGANLSGANLSGANLSDADYNDYTIWPTGFKTGEDDGRKTIFSTRND